MKSLLPLRLSIPLALAALGVSLTTIGVIHDWARSSHNLETALLERALSLSHIVVPTIEQAALEGDAAAAEEAVDRLALMPQTSLALVCDATNGVVHSTDFTLRNRVLSATPVASAQSLIARARATIAAQAEIAPDGASVCVAFPFYLEALPGELHPSRLGVLYTQTDLLAPKRELLNGILQRTLLMGVVALLACFLVWAYLRATFTRHLDKLVAGVAAYVSGRGELRVPAEGSHELAQVGRVLNQLFSDLLRLNNLYAALSQVNQLLTRAKTRAELLTGVCEVLVRHGKLKIAWIGWRDQRTQAVTPVAQYGDETGYLSQIKISAEDRPEGRGPAGVALREGRWVVCNDFIQAPETALWHDQAERVGIGSAAAFPILEEGRIRGVLVVYAGEPEFFRDKEVLLFEEAAVDVSFALDHLEQEARRERAEAALRQKTEELDRYFTSALDLLCIADTAGFFRRLNPAWEQTLGFPLTELEGSRYLAWVHPDDQQLTQEALTQLSTQRSGRSFTNRCRSIDGTYRWIEWRVFAQGELIYATARDMTRHQEAVAALKASEERFRQMAEKIDSVFWIADPVLFQMLYVSPAYEKIWGRSCESLFQQPRSFLAMVHPEDRARVAASLRAERGEQQRAFDLEYRILRSDGAVRWIRDRGFPVRDQTGRVTKLVGIADDITERELVNARLRESEQKFHGAFANAVIGVAICRPDGLCVDANPAFCRITGYSLEEMRSLEYGQLVHPDDLPENRRLRMGMLAGEANDFVIENRLLRKGGTSVWVRKSDSLIRDAAGKPQWLIVLVEDITERRRAEAELRKLSQAVEQSSVGIVITDPTGAVEYVNPRFTRLTGYTLDEARGRSLLQLQANEDSILEHRLLWQSVTRGGQWHGELHNRKKNGEWYWEYASFSPILDAGGRVIHLLAMKEDITERKAMEVHLRQAQKMESVGQLAGGVAHDFNNILAAMMMQLSYLQLRSELDPETRQALKELMDEAKRAASLTRQLLLFSRRSVMEVKALDLNEVVGNLLKMLGRLIGEHIHLRFEPQAALPTVEADPGMIEQVLMNLSVNARDAMPKGGTLTIRLEIVQVDEAKAQLRAEARPGRFVCLSVADTGCGMDEATLQHIFEPFFTTKGLGKGTGLGLATVHGIVGQHKGWVEVESCVGQGTVFRVLLPIVSQQASPAVPSENSELVRGVETILLVEDEANVRRVTAQTLRLLGYRVLEAANGQEALRLWNAGQAQVDLLLSDMVMPEGLNGLELAETLRRARPGLRVVLSSGYGEEIAVQGLPTEKNTFRLQKPYQLEVLARAVRQCLDQK